MMITVLAACRGTDGDEPDVRAFEAAMVDEYGASPEQAACIAGYVLAEYPPDDVRTIQAEGISALPLTRWEPYLGTVFACLNQASAGPG